MERLDRELTRIVSEMRAGDFGILDEYRRRLGVRGALGKLARGWLIERARTKRLRKQLENARDHADFWRHEALLRLDDDPAEVYGDDLPHLWEADQAAKGGE